MWFKIQGHQVKLQIIAKPNAKKTAIVKITEQGLHVALHAKPHKSEANKELILFLSDVFDVPKNKITIKAGESNKYKQVIIPLTTTVQRILNDLRCNIGMNK
jgi:uncharacterized protein (TIGR00251 family)